MEPPVNLCVNHDGESQNFLVSDSNKTTWADVEAMVLVSFDLSNIQIKYVDEENEEVSVNSQVEYEEALKIGVKQGGILQMNVYEKTIQHQTPDLPCQDLLQNTAEQSSPPPARSGKRPLGHYSSLARAVGQEMPKLEISNSKEKPGEAEIIEPVQPEWFTSYLDREQRGQNEVRKSTEMPPDWFTNYMKMFKEQIVRETVERVNQSFREKLVQTQEWMSDSSSSSVALQESERPASVGSLHDWLLACSNCQHQILGVRYQCSTCPSYSICEQCEAENCDHDPNHLFLKMRRPVEPRAQGQLASHQFSMEQVRFQKQMDKTFLKAEKQRLRAEKKQRKAEVKELKKQLKLHRKIYSWSSLESPPTSQTEMPQNSQLVIPIQPCSQIIPTLSAVFVDENLPDGTHLQPGTRFIKHWRMKNTGNVRWNSDTKLNFMWGNLTLASSSRKDATVPSLLPGQVGVLSVEFIAPALEGTYTSHWRLAHKGEQFGPRVWCSIIVDSLPCTDNMEDMEKGLTSLRSSNRSHQEEDLLSFELLDINIVQELERVPHNTPVDMTPCMSPLPHDGPLIEKPCLGQIEEENEGNGYKTLAGLKKPQEKVGRVAPHDEAEEDISGTQFVCETVMRSLTLDAAPDYNPPQKKTSTHSSLQSSPQISFNYSTKSDEFPIQKLPSVISSQESQKTEVRDVGDNINATDSDLYGDGQAVPDEEDPRDETESQGSCTSTEDYIIILPECFDTSRPLGESMYSSALSETGCDKEKQPEPCEDIGNQARANQPHAHSINDILTTSQTLDTVPLMPEVLQPSPHLRASEEPQVLSMSVDEDVGAAAVSTNTSERIYRGPIDDCPPRMQTQLDDSTPRHCFDNTRQHPRVSIAGGLVKGALSVAASAYKALFTGQQESVSPTCSEEQASAMMAILLEMGFCDRQLNQRLLRKHNYNLMDVVTELIQINDNDWYSARY
ncbi:next to BRCA1 gene 1 protein isoform X2 [Bombina bombina]|uniref:next to BRCA1 gene 1 protein isoform X2 n=1 Tax=Bombina bombina TaxID=8345 RepID=UPI00235A7ECE|nr:next to BRCA1 gene 1 protein isoform X2 [Bombina bombina]